MKDESEDINGDKCVIMLRNIWSCVGVSGEGMMCTALTLAGSGCAHPCHAHI